jgi:hypothetical protein
VAQEQSLRHTGNCVEVAITDLTVGIRDSKNPSGPMLVVTRDGWREFLATLQSEQA